MSKSRVPVTCLVVCLLAGPWTNAFAAAADDAPIPGLRQSTTAFSALSVDNPAFSLAPGAAPALSAKGRQAVAKTNEPKLLLGVAAGALIVAGVAMLTYSATSTCKGLHESTSSCDKKAVIGSMAVAGGTVMLVVWNLSRP